MQAKATSCAVVGLEAAPIHVEVDTGRGLPSIPIGGLSNVTVQESRERVRAAIRNIDLSFPQSRLTINLAPADVRKEGPPTICPSPWAFCWPPSKSSPTWRAPSLWENYPWTGVYDTSRACCRWR